MEYRAVIGRPSAARPPARPAAVFRSTSARGMHNSIATAEHIEGLGVGHHRRLLIHLGGELPQGLQVREGRVAVLRGKAGGARATWSWPISGIGGDRLADHGIVIRIAPIDEDAEERETDRAAEIARHVVQARRVAGLRLGHRGHRGLVQRHHRAASVPRRAGAATRRSRDRRFEPSGNIEHAAHARRHNSPAITMMRGSTVPSSRGRIGIIRNAGSAGQQHDVARTARRCSRRRCSRTAAADTTRNIVRRPPRTR